jgi:hypothetical protein
MQPRVLAFPSISTMHSKQQPIMQKGLRLAPLIDV